MPKSGQTPIGIKEYQIVTFTNGTPIIDMTITHFKTGKSVSGSGKMEYTLKKDLIAKLQDKIKTIRYLRIKDIT